jgi:hypothetical protein
MLFISDQSHGYVTAIVFSSEAQALPLEMRIQVLALKEAADLALYAAILAALHRSEQATNASGERS